MQVGQPARGRRHPPLEVGERVRGGPGPEPADVDPAEAVGDGAQVVAGRVQPLAVGLDRGRVIPDVVLRGRRLPLLQLGQRVALVPPAHHVRAVPVHSWSSSGSAASSRCWTCLRCTAQAAAPAAPSTPTGATAAATGSPPVPTGRCGAAAGRGLAAEAERARAGARSGPDRPAGERGGIDRRAGRGVRDGTAGRGDPLSGGGKEKSISGRSR